MGWTYLPYSGTTDSYFRTQMLPNTKVLGSATVGGCWYGVIECDGPDERFVADADGKYRTMVVCLVKRNKRAADGYTFGYKDMCETMGPCESKAPVRLLDMLSPLNATGEDKSADWAAAWRQRCREYAETSAAMRAKKARMVVGTRFRLPAPVSFGSYGMADTFTVVEPLMRRGRKVTVYRAEPGFLCRLTLRCLAGAEIIA